MASLLKNQIVKHLAKFFKNLSADSLNLSLRGHCHLNNLELNEDFLMEIFEFPVWLNLKKAVVNKCFIDVPYTKIKSQPCQLILDQVFIEIETVENFRQNTNYFNRLTQLSNGKYGLGERIIDGLKVKIDSVEIHFTSSAFNAQLTLLQIMVESRLPNFKPATNISQTKIKDTNRNQILIFKYIEWASLRFEAKSETKTEELQTQSSPLRLITRNGNCKVTLKKSLLDCSTLSARIQLNFFDLLFILTDATVLNFIHLLNYVTQLMNKAPMNKKNLFESSPAKSQSLKKNSSMNNLTDISRLFSQYNIPETSMHLIINSLQLHLSDDLNRSCFSSLKNGGGLHIILQKLLIDFYPYHKALQSRDHWLYYAHSVYKSNIDPFINEHLKSFFKINDQTKNYQSLFSENSFSDKRLKDLLSFVILIRIGDYKINCVSTSENDSKKDKKFSKDERILVTTAGTIPADLPAIHVEINQYYYMEPGSNRYSTRIKSPKPTLFCNVGPSFINFDIVSMLWLNAFYSSIHKSLLKFAATLPQPESDSEFHILAEIVLPTFIINLRNFYNEDELPANSFEMLEIKSTKIQIKNSKGNPDDIEKLDNLFSKIRLSKLFSDLNQYPWIKNNQDFNFNCEQLIGNLKKEVDNCLIGFNNQFLIVNFEPFWCDLKQTNLPNSLTTFIEPFDFCIWIQVNKNIKQSIEPHLNVYCCFPDLKLHLDHFSYLFLIRLLEKIDYFSNILKSDFTRIQDNDKQIGIDLINPPLILISTVLPHIELFIELKTYDLLDKNKFLIQSNSSDKLSFILPDNNEFENLKLNKKSNDRLSTNDLIDDENIMHLNDQMNNNNPFIDYSLNDNFDNTNLVSNTLIFNKGEEISKSTFETSTSSLTKVGDSFIGLFNQNSKNGYLSYTNMSTASLIEEDTRSIKSDLSVESEKFILNFEDEQDSFVFRPADNDENNVEEAIEITENTLIKYDSINSKQTHENSVQSKKNRLISYLKLTIRNVSFLNQNKDFIATILASIHELEFDSYFKVPYDQYENQLNSNLSLFKPIDYSNEPNLICRFDTDTKALSSDKSHKEMISACIQGVDLKVLDKRFIDCLTEFLLDKDAVQVSRLKILINDLKLKIKDEQLKTPVINLNLNNILIDRNTKNEIQIGSFNSKNDCLLSAHQKIINRFKSDNSNLDIDCDQQDEIEFTKEDYLKLIEENRQLKLILNTNKT